MKATSILLVTLILAAPALAEIDQQEELRVIDATTKYLVEHPFPYYRHHWKVIVASDSRLRFQPLFVPSRTRAARPEMFEEATVDLTTRNATSIRLANAPEGLGLADAMKFETAGGYDWETVHKHHFDLDAVLEMSRPGFDRSETFAIVVSHTTNNAGGASATVCELAKDAAGTWTVIGMISSPGIRPPVPQAR